MRSGWVLGLLCLLAVTFSAEGLGSLTSVGSVTKKTRYDCVIRSLAEDFQGRLWAGTFGSGLLTLKGDEWSATIATAGGLPDMRISKVIVDEGGISVATVGGGASRLDFASGKWGSISSGAGSAYFHAFLTLPGNRVLLGSVGEGVFLSSGTTWIHLLEQNGLPSNWVNDALPSPEGIWLATAFGTALIREDRVLRVETPQDEWKDVNVNVLVRFAGDIYIGCGSGGLIHRIPETASASVAASARPGTGPRRPRPRFQKIQGVPDQVHALLEWQDRLWIGTENGLFSLGKDLALKPEVLPKENTAVKSLGLYKGSLVLGTDLGAIYHLHGSEGWVKIFEYTSSRNLGGPRK